jgi:hypothetical protein
VGDTEKSEKQTRGKYLTAALLVLFVIAIFAYTFASRM